MDKKKGITVASILASGVILGSTVFCQLGLINNQEIRDDYNDAVANENIFNEELAKLKKYKTISDITSYIGAMSLGAAMGVLVSSNLDKVDKEEENVM